MSILEQIINIEDAKYSLEEVLKPFQQDLNRRQKRFDFVKKCIQSIEKNDFFRLDELLKSKQASEALADTSLEALKPIFSQLQEYANEQIELYKLEFKNGLIQTAEKVGLPIQVNLPRIFVMNGIEGSVDFSTRQTKLNDVLIKSFDPKRIVSVALNLKRKLYDTVFEPQVFIESLFACYQEILKKEKLAIGDSVSIYQLYTDYVWSLQSKAFLQNMDKAKFRGYSVEQFGVDFWRFFTSNVLGTKEGYSIRLAPGRIKSLSLIDQTGEKRYISHASFVKG